MKRTIGIGALLVAAVLGLTTTGCSIFDRSGTVVLSLTDSPVLASNVAHAYISIARIEYTTGDGAATEWPVLKDYGAEPALFDLLALQGGTVAALADVELPAGHVGQIRFVLDAGEATTGSGAPTTSGCYLVLADGTEVPLFVPSGTSSGFKAVGAFDVPLNGTVEITADFDVRKSLVKRGALDSYILKPTIRLVVNDEAGGLNVTVTGGDASQTLVVYAYEDGTYADTEAEEPASEADDPQFAGAVTSAAAGAGGAFALRFLAAGTYDLVVAGYDADGALVEVAGVYQDAQVVSNANTAVAIDLTAAPTANVVLSLTDSPVLDADVVKAVVAFTAIEYRTSSDGAEETATWQTLVAFDEPQEFDLLTLQGGTVAPLADVWLPSGHIGQIRFVLDAEEATTGGGAPTTSGCYLELADGTRLPLFVPSGTSSGFKAVGAFDVPLNGSVEVTADFDVRKSVVARGGAQGGYILKPTIRLVVDDACGTVVVTLVDAAAGETLVVYAYEEGTYSDAEAVLPVVETDAPQFSGAVASATVCDQGNYRLAFLAAGTYDLVVAAYDADGGFLGVRATEEGVAVTVDGATPVTIDLAP